MSGIHRLFVPGVPAPQGSKRHVGGGIMVEASKRLKPWRDSIVDRLLDCWGTSPLAGPVAVNVTFVMPRPKSHYRTGKYADSLKPSAPDLHTSKPDVDKLMRAVLDALTIAGVIRDDAQVAAVVATKRYAAISSAAGATITVEPL